MRLARRTDVKPPPRMGSIGNNRAMAKIGRLPRGVGPVGIALTAFDLWTRLSPAQRRQLMRITRQHGPAVARAAAKAARDRRAKPKP